jgi:hypothetical protein
MHSENLPTKIPVVIFIDIMEVSAIEDPENVLYGIDFLSSMYHYIDRYADIDAYSVIESGDVDKFDRLIYKLFNTAKSGMKNELRYLFQRYNSGSIEFISTQDIQSDFVNTCKLYN